MFVRKLALFIVDDRAVAGFLFHLFDVNRTPYGWRTHCLDAAGNKQLTYDLLSSDINYSEDTTDPDQSSDPDKFNSWGLVHAVAVLARRKPVDDEGNVLPFEWEIRSASPQLVRGDLWATRLYGLLRSLAAQPRDGESLSDCIQREHEERWNKPLVTQAIEEGICDYPLLFSDDLAEQPPQDSFDEIMVKQLLPKWRAKLLVAVRTGQVRLHLRTLEKCVKHLKSRSLIDINDAGDGELCIPLSSGVTGNFAYGINLFSVLADLFSRDEVDATGQFSLDPGKPFEALRTGDKGYPGPVSVHAWMDYLRELVSGLQTPTGLDKVMLAVADRLEECLEKPDGQATGDALNKLIASFKADYTRMGMLYILLVARRQMRGHFHTRSKDLVTAYDRIAINVHTFTRPLREKVNVFPQLGGADALGKEICNAMSGRAHLLGAFWLEWIKPGLARWHEKYGARLDPSGKNYAKYAPGLQ